MYNILKFTIQSGNFKLSDIQYRVKKLYAAGDISEEQMDELFSLIVENATIETERPETLDLIQTLSGKLDALTARVKAMEKGNTTGGTDEDDTTEYPAWEPWDGLSDQYKTGAIVEHNGQLWQSVYSGQNVWEPGTVDDRFWVKYSPEA